MRTLQRLQHRRSPGPHAQDRIRQIEQQAVSRFERRVWLNRARRLGPWALVALAATALVAWVLEGRTVIDGLVQANLVVARAPEDVRVAEVFVSSGQHCRRGDPLVRLESLVGEGERRALALEVERRALRLELARAGAGLEVVELGQRRDQSLQAELELRLAADGRATAEARLETLVFSAESESLRLQQEHDQKGGEVASLEEQVRAAEARVSAARRQLDLAWMRIESHTDETDARVETARREVAALSSRQAAWTDLAELRRRILPDELPDAGVLQELELALLEVELAEAEARLDGFDRTVGNVVVRAAFDGVVDQVLVSAGFVAAKESELVSYFDPETLRIVAYAPAKHAGGIASGERCSIFPVGSTERLEGRIAWRGYAWVPTPPALRVDDKRPAGLRLPMVVDYVRPEGVDPLTPNRRVRLVFGFDSELEAGLLGD